MGAKLRLHREIAGLPLAERVVMGQLGVDRDPATAEDLAALNVIDAAALRLHKPVVVGDLPAGGRRLDRTAHGYVATIVPTR